MKNWPNEDEVIKKISNARAEGLQITADMYTYPAGATGLDGAMPPWVQEGGLEAWRKRLQDTTIRKRVKQEMATSNTYDNLFASAESPDKILLVGFKSDKLKPLTGKSLGEVARMRHESPEETAMDLVVEDDSRVETVFASRLCFRGSASHPILILKALMVCFSSSAPTRERLVTLRVSMRNMCGLRNC